MEVPYVSPVKATSHPRQRKRGEVSQGAAARMADKGHDAKNAGVRESVLMADKGHNAKNVEGLAFAFTTE